MLHIFTGTLIQKSETSILLLSHQLPGPFNNSPIPKPAPMRPVLPVSNCSQASRVASAPPCNNSDTRPHATMTGRTTAMEVVGPEVPTTSSMNHSHGISSVCLIYLSIGRIFLKYLCSLIFTYHNDINFKEKYSRTSHKPYL